MGTENSHYQIGAGSRILYVAILLIKTDQTGFKTDREYDTESRWSAGLLELSPKR